jgi:hypothetical protein
VPGGFLVKASVVPPCPLLSLVAYLGVFSHADRQLRRGVEQPPLPERRGMTEGSVQPLLRLEATGTFGRGCGVPR